MSEILSEKTPNPASMANLLKKKTRGSRFFTK
jgi:hypothetical protein